MARGCYEVIESFSRGKVSEDMNEDALVLADSYAAVIDGSTSKGTLPYPKTSGRLASEILKAAIERMPEGLSIYEAADYMTDEIACYYTQNSILERTEKCAADRITASAVIYSAERNEIWQIGDCPCLIDGIPYGNQKYWEQPLAEARALFLEKEIAGGRSIDDLRANDTGREFILPLLRFSTCYQNNGDSEYGYAVIDGFRIPRKLLVCYHLEEGQHEIVLASDGYINLMPTLKESEELIGQYMREDPLCIHMNKMTKGLRPDAASFDDRTYLRIRTI